MTPNVLNLQLTETDNRTARLRYFPEDQPHDVFERTFDLAEIGQLIERADRDYYFSSSPDGYKFDASRAEQLRLGQTLYNWLDSADRYLERRIGALQAGQLLVLALQGDTRLLHLPWELLHDGRDFLISRRLLPVRQAMATTTTRPRPPADRALNAIFMASSPRQLRPVLSFELEETAILDATAKIPMHLVVEETGSLSELALSLLDYGAGYFDVVHLTGHGRDEPPAFIAENEIGDPSPADAEALRKALQDDTPPLLFVSACYSGGAPGGGGEASLAENLAHAGFPAVLGWARPVTDRSSTAATAVLFNKLAAGMSVPEATHAAISELLNAQPQRIDWHYLRLFTYDRTPGSLVTRRRHTAPRVSLSDEFLDPLSYRVRVPSRRGFVGRRRVLQKCLRVLRDPSGDKNGVVLAGMGGLGKSSTAARLLDRLKDRCRTAVWIGRLDETSLLSRLIPFAANQAASLALQQIAEPLEQRLGRLFEVMPHDDKRFLFIFDDFEQNFENDAEGRPLLSPEGQPRLLPAAAQVLEQLMRAVRAVPHSSPPSLIFTSRYKIPGYHMRHIEQIDLPDMDAADLRKFTDVKGLDDKKRAEPVYQRAMALAAGNPRLLEWLLAVLEQPSISVDSLLERLEAKVAEFRESVLLEYLLECLSPASRQALEKLCLYRLPVPPAALAPLLPAGAEVPRALDSAVALGLAETETDAYGIPGRHYRAHGLLYIQDDSPPTEEAAIAARTLYALWVKDKEEGLDTLRLEELLRLALLGSVGEVAAYSASKLGHRLYNSGLYRDALHCCEAALPLCPDDFRLLHALARAEVLLGETARARTHYETALAACPREHSEYPSLLHNMANLYSMQCEFDRAMLMFEESLTIYQRLGEPKGIGSILLSMAKLYVKQGEEDRPMSLCEEALNIMENLGDQDGKGSAMLIMANLYRVQGNFGRAMSMYQETLGIVESLGDKQGKGETLRSIAKLYRMEKRFDQSMPLYEESLDIMESLGDKQGKGETLFELACVHKIKGEDDLAISKYKDSLDIFESLGDKQGKEATMLEMAELYNMQGEVALAKEYYAGVLKISGELGNLSGMSTTLRMIAQIAAHTGAFDESLKNLVQAESLLTRMGAVSERDKVRELIQQVQEMKDQSSGDTLV